MFHSLHFSSRFDLTLAQLPSVQIGGHPFVCQEQYLFVRDRTCKQELRPHPAPRKPARLYRCARLALVLSTHSLSTSQSWPGCTRPSESILSALSIPLCWIHALVSLPPPPPAPLIPCLHHSDCFRLGQVQNKLLRNPFLTSFGAYATSHIDTDEDHCLVSSSFLLFPSAVFRAILMLPCDSSLVIFARPHSVSSPVICVPVLCK